MSWRFAAFRYDAADPLAVLDAQTKATLLAAVSGNTMTMRQVTVVRLFSCAREVDVGQRPPVASSAP